MIRCPVCRAKHPQNTLFCDECGAYLQGGGGGETGLLATRVVTVIWTERQKIIEIPKKEVVSPVSLRLSIPDSRRAMELPLGKEMTIGRLDPTNNCFPEVDLTNHGGLRKGVSRWHAKIIRRGDKVFIEDLASINGTFLNRRRLTPYFPQALRSGDELQLGKLTLWVSFQ